MKNVCGSFQTAMSTAKSYTRKLRRPRAADDQKVLQIFNLKTLPTCDAGKRTNETGEKERNKKNSSQESAKSIVTDSHASEKSTEAGRRNRGNENKIKYSSQRKPNPSPTNSHSRKHWAFKSTEIIKAY